MICSAISESGDDARFVSARRDSKVERRSRGVDAWVEVSGGGERSVTRGRIVGESYR